MRVTESGKLFNSLLLRFVNASLPILHASSTTHFAIVLRDWFTSFLSSIDQRLRLSSSLNDRQQLALLANAFYAAASLQEHTWQLVINKGGEESFYESLSTCIAAQYATVQRQLCSMRAEAVIAEKMDWRNHIYEDSSSCLSFLVIITFLMLTFASSSRVPYAPLQQNHKVV